MTDGAAQPDTRPAASAGAMLRAARQAQGLHIAALAASLKVSPRKLEALEADRYDDLQGATFVRALAQAACRTLKIDPAPVLAELPEQDRGALSQMGGGLNEPFREHGTRREAIDLPPGSRIIVMVVLVLLIGALAFWLLPPGWSIPGLMASRPAASAPGSVEPLAPAAEPAPPPASSAMTVGAAVPVAAEAPQPEPAASQATPAMASASPLQLKARSASWVEVIDGRDQTLLARTLAAGEVVAVDGAMPLRVKIGNVAATELSFRGQTVDLASVARDNVARLELK
ncbi:MAG: helix-turn-helix domain-containing protein [Vitreoscilla sp.]|nr:helix-turn-helix domain-containing protein [Vitreoscilla sp.]